MIVNDYRYNCNMRINHISQSRRLVNKFGWLFIEFLCLAGLSIYRYKLTSEHIYHYQQYMLKATRLEHGDGCLSSWWFKYDHNSFYCYIGLRIGITVILLLIIIHWLRIMKTSWKHVMIGSLIYSVTVVLRWVFVDGHW